ncbi:MAG: 1-acyl-sn-glycerol-3-phosphate acyltransferase [Gammaproteobacteria bacterium]|jgi:1-acyl-sn-glycerol-3-phosphate acyltransferase
MMAKIETGFVGQSFGSRALYRLVRTLACGFTQLYTRMSIEGREHLPTAGAYIIAPVHRSYVDTPISACISRRRIRYMGKDSMWKFASVGKLISALGAFPVSRGTVDREALTRCLAVLDAGEPLVLFPEGERKDGPTIQPLFDGAAYLASKSGVPIIPLGIAGSDRVMPRGAKFIFPRKVKVMIGAPIRVEVGENGRASRHAIKTTTAHLHVEIQGLYDKAQSKIK